MSLFGVILVQIFPVFSRIRIECREILLISTYSVSMRENAKKMRTRMTPNTDTFLQSRSLPKLFWMFVYFRVYNHNFHSMFFQLVNLIVLHWLRKSGHQWKGWYKAFFTNKGDGHKVGHYTKNHISQVLEYHGNLKKAN